jgi:hypothetical protein
MIDKLTSSQDKLISSSHGNFTSNGVEPRNFFLFSVQRHGLEDSRSEKTIRPPAASDPAYLVQRRPIARQPAKTTTSPLCLATL